MKVDRLINWLKSAPPGAKVVYHEGFLALDRTLYKFINGTFQPFANPALDAIAELMWGSYRMGKVLLYQERVGPGVWRYWAQKRRNSE